MWSGSSDSESITKCKFETTSESDKESVRGCYNNEPEYSQEEIDKMKVLLWYLYTSMLDK